MFSSYFLIDFFNSIACRSGKSEWQKCVQTTTKARNYHSDTYTYCSFKMFKVSGVVFF